jgi:SAM-dependent methyltransferase
MRIDITNMRKDFLKAQSGKASDHSAMTRRRPSIWQYDYLTLKTLADDIECLLHQAAPASPGAVALDLGAFRSPYGSLVEALGYELRTLDLTLENGADFAGTVEATGLADASFDLVICTQVLEHCDDPWRGVAEIRRILKPEGKAILSAPHVWFFHPHPHDHWRFTQEGMLRLCRSGGLEPELLLSQGGSVLAAGQIANFLLYGAIGRVGAPAFALINGLSRWGDRLLPNVLFSHNFACLARRC